MNQVVETRPSLKKLLPSRPPLSIHPRLDSKRVTGAAQLLPPVYPAPSLQRRCVKVWRQVGFSLQLQLKVKSLQVHLHTSLTGDSLRLPHWATVAHGISKTYICARGLLRTASVDAVGRLRQSSRVTVSRYETVIRRLRVSSVGSVKNQTRIQRSVTSTNISAEVAGVSYLTKHGVDSESQHEMHPYMTDRSMSHFPVL